MTSIREITEEQFHSFLSLDIPVAIWTKLGEPSLDNSRFVVGSNPILNADGMTYKDLYRNLSLGYGFRFFTLVEEDEDAAT